MTRQILSWVEPDIAQTTRVSALTRSISLGSDLLAEPVQLGSVVRIERDAELLERLRSGGEEPPRILGVTTSGCHRGPIQAAPRVAVGVVDGSSVALPESRLGLIDVAEMKLDPSEVVLLHHNPRCVAEGRSTTSDGSSFISAT